MAAGDVGRQVLYRTADGDQLGWVVEYEAGRDAGDHLIGGFTNDAAQKGGSGPYFSDWSVFRSEAEPGTFRWA